MDKINCIQEIPRIDEVNISAYKNSTGITLLLIFVVWTCFVIVHEIMSADDFKW